MDVNCGMIELVGFDGDDTLWHDENLFTSSRGRFAELLGPFCDEDILCSRLYEIELRNLRTFGYGVKGFTLSMIETAIEISEYRITSHQIQSIIDIGKQLIAHPVQLIDGVRETLAELGRQYRLILITKGDLFHQEAKIARSALGSLFGAIEVVSEKDTGAYRRILCTNNVAPERFLMVGNSIRSDALPVLEIGGSAVIVPYPLVWKHEEAAIQNPPRDRFRIVPEISQIPSVLRELDHRAA